MIILGDTFIWKSARILYVTSFVYLVRIYLKVFPLFCSRQSTGEEGQRNFTSQIRTSRVITLLGRTSSITNGDVCSCNLRRPWNNNLEEREERSGNQRAGPPLSKVRNDFFFFFTTKREEEKRKRKKAEECTRQDEGGQARVTRWIEYLRGTPFAWKIERCSSIKVALHEKKNNELEKKEFVSFRFSNFLFHFLSIGSSWLLYLESFWQR